MNNNLDTTPEPGACQPGQPVSQAGNDLYARIVDFLKSLPNLSNETMQRAFLFGFDAGFREYIRCGLPLAEFVPLLVATALNYGVLQDGRHALRAVLESAQRSVGADRRAVCAGLLRELDDYLRTAAASRPEQSVSNIVAGNQRVVSALRQQSAPSIGATPYKFLASYDITDRAIFFGRDEVIEKLLGLIPRHKTLVINGRSGAGKTSLLHAGLIPRLAEAGYQYLAFRDYSDPLRQLREYVAQSDLFKPYADQAHSLPRLLKALSREQPVALIFDQFERFFVNVSPSLRAHFIQEVKACLDSNLSSAEAHLLFALRQDFFGTLVIEFQEQIETFFNDSELVNLLPLRKDEARDVILQPIKTSAARIGYDLRFVDEVLLPGLMNASEGDARIDPPHVQIVCNQLYQAACERYAAELKQGGMAQIDRQLYAQLGETRGILRTYLDDVLDRAAYHDTTRRDVLRSMLKVMVESTGTRKFVALPDLRQGLPDVPANDLERYVQQLQTSRVLETRGSGADTHYSLSHEVLVEKVQNWCDERELQRKKAQETLMRGLAEWQSTQALLNAKQVAHIRQWIGADGLPQQAEQLLNASQQAHEERLRKEAEQERRIKLGQRIISGLVMLAFIIAIVLSAWALWEQNIAQRQIEVARVHSLTANANLYTSRGEREIGALLARQAYLLNNAYNTGLDDQITDALRAVLAVSEGTADVLAEQVCQQATRNLTDEEWQRTVGRDKLVYEHCSNLPGAAGVSDVLPLRSTSITTDNWQQLSLKVRVDRYVKTDTLNQFEERGDVIFDKATNLMWEKAGSSEGLNHAEADTYCTNLRLHNQKDWRLPTVEELASLVEPEKPVLSFGLTADDLKELSNGTAPLPENVIGLLRPLTEAEQEFRAEAEFLSAVQQAIGSDAAAQYQQRLIEQAKHTSGYYINPLFPMGSYGWYWSTDIYTTKGKGSAESWWHVSFNHGYVSWSYDSGYAVRCVRSGQ